MRIVLLRLVALRRRLRTAESDVARLGAALAESEHMRELEAARNRAREDALLDRVLSACKLYAVGEVRPTPLRPAREPEPDGSVFQGRGEGQAPTTAAVREAYHAEWLAAAAERGVPPEQAEDDWKLYLETGQMPHQRQAAATAGEGT